MGAQFQVDVNVVTHGAGKVNELEQKLSKMQNKPVDIKFNVQGQKQLTNLMNQIKQVQNMLKGMPTPSIPNNNLPRNNNPGRNNNPNRYPTNKLKYNVYNVPILDILE